MSCHSLYEARDVEQAVNSAGINVWFERVSKDLALDQKTDLGKFLVDFLSLAAQRQAGLPHHRWQAHQGSPIEPQAGGLMPAEVDSRIEAKIERLRSMPIVELRALWRAKFKSDPPGAFGPDLLRRSIAQKLQEDAYGGLDRATARLLKQLIAQYTTTPGKIVVPRQIKPGAVLVREWKGQSHRVVVLEEGFAYQNRPYESLSEVARLITGTRWNGPKFFGLRKDKE